MIAIIGQLLDSLEEWFQIVESVEKENAKGGSYFTVVGGALKHITLIVKVIQKDTDSWKEVSKFAKQQYPRYTSSAVRGWLELLSEIAKLFT